MWIRITGIAGLAILAWFLVTWFTLVGYVVLGALGWGQ